MPSRKRTKKKERPSWPLNPGHDRGVDIDVSPFALPEQEEAPARKPRPMKAPPVKCGTCGEDHGSRYCPQHG